MRPTEAGAEEAELALRFQAKEAIRGRMVRVRRAVPGAARAARSEKVAASVMALPEWRAAKGVAAYVAMGGETDPAPLVAAAHAAGKRVFYPCIDMETNEMNLRVYAPGDELEESGYGFLQPSGASAAVADDDVDFVIIPAVAVDERGYRVGYGRGYYDRFLPRVSKAFRVTIGFDFQLLAELPNTPGDERAHAVVTDGHVIRVGDV